MIHEHTQFSDRIKYPFEIFNEKIRKPSGNKCSLCESKFIVARNHKLEKQKLCLDVEENLSDDICAYCHDMGANNKVKFVDLYGLDTWKKYFYISSEEIKELLVKYKHLLTPRRKHTGTIKSNKKIKNSGFNKKYTKKFPSKKNPYGLTIKKRGK